jgi:hypothetical protein
MKRTTKPNSKMTATLLTAMALLLSIAFGSHSSYAQLPSFTRAYEITGPFTRISNNNSNMIVTPYYASNIIGARSNGYLMANNVNDGDGSMVVRLTAVTPNGSIIWSKAYGTWERSVRCFAITYDSRDNGYVLTGYRSNTEFERRRDKLWVLKVDKDGNALREYSFSVDSIPCTIGGNLEKPCTMFTRPSIYGMDIIQVKKDKDETQNGDFVIAGFVSDKPAVEEEKVLKRNFVWRFRIPSEIDPVDYLPKTKFLKVFHSWGNASDNEPTKDDFSNELQEIPGYGLMVTGHVTPEPITPSPPTVEMRPYYALMNYDGGGSSIQHSDVFAYANYYYEGQRKHVRVLYGKDDVIYLLGYSYPKHAFTITPMKPASGGLGYTNIYSSSDAKDLPAFSIFESRNNSDDLVVMGYRLGLNEPTREDFVHPYTIMIGKNGNILSKFNLETIRSQGYLSYVPADPVNGNDFFKPFDKVFPQATLPEIGLMNRHLASNDAVVAGVHRSPISLPLNDAFNASLTQFESITEKAECKPYTLPPQRDSVLLRYSDLKFNINNFKFLTEEIRPVVSVVGTILTCREMGSVSEEIKTQGINNISGVETAFTIYPNPASEEVNIKASIPGEYTLQISTITGASIYTAVYNYTYTVPVHNWADGIYLMKITSKEGQQYMYKLVKGKK